MRNLPPDHPAHCYKGVWDQLSTRKDPDGRLLLIMDGARIVVPRLARKRILELLHRPHAGIVKTQQAARQLYYWPGMSAAVSDAVENVSSARRPCPASRWRPRWPPPRPLGPCRRWVWISSTPGAATTSSW